MKVFVMKDLLKKSIKELVAMRSKTRKALYDMKLKSAVRSLNQTHLIAVARKNVARINTAMKQKVSIAK